MTGKRSTIDITRRLQTNTARCWEIENNGTTFMHILDTSRLCYERKDFYDCVCSGTGSGSGCLKKALRPSTVLADVHRLPNNPPVNSAPPIVTPSAAAMPMAADIECTGWSQLVG